MFAAAPKWIAVGALCASLAAATYAAAAGSGIRGRVTASPTCPVERIPPDPACAPRGFSARVRIYRLSDGRTVKRFNTGDDGRFAVAVGPGHYAVVARPASAAVLPRCAGPVKVTVHTRRYSRAAIDCDSGIR